MNEQNFLTTKINNVGMQEVLDAVSERIGKRDPGYIVELNVDVVLKTDKDPELKRACNEAMLSLADGKPLIWISKIFKEPLKEKISGSDLVPALCQRAANENHKIFMLGGENSALKQAISNLEDRCPGINIAGSYSPPFGFEKDEKELEKMDELIRSCSPDLLFVFFGCPKQEKWVMDHYKKAGAIVTVCAGGTVDFLSGNIKRAPKWMSNHGLEWFFRFLMEPKRLFKRYFIDDPAIVFLVYRYWKRRKNVTRNFMYHD